MSLALALALSACQDDEFWDRPALTGDRGALEEKGVTLEAALVTDAFLEASDGDGSVDALLRLGADADLERLIAWPGASARAGVLRLEGEGLVEDGIGTLTNPSNINGLDELRVFDAWIQQDLLDGDVSLRGGLLAADEEFMVSEHALLFLNSTFGPPGSLSTNLPMPIYPVAAPGGRVRVSGGPATVRAGVFDGDPGGEEFNDTGVRVRWDESEGTLSILEAGLSWEEGGVKAGALYHTGHFTRLETGSDRSASHGVYAVVDHRFMEELEGFVRWTWSPGEWSPVPHYVDAGIVALGKAGLAVGWLEMSDDLPGRSREVVFEVTWREEVAPWWTLQPDAQVILDPGGIPSEETLWILGIRTEILF